MVVRLAGSRLMLWFESTLAWRIFGWRLVPRLVRLTGGRLSLIPAVRTALLETKDARNGRPHRRVVIYFHDGERVTIIPSKGGLPEDPFWYENAMAEPNVVFGGQSFRAELVLDEAQQAPPTAPRPVKTPAFVGTTRSSTTSTTSSGYAAIAAAKSPRLTASK